MYFNLNTVIFWDCNFYFYLFLFFFIFCILLTIHPNIMIVFFTNFMNRFFVLIHLLYSSTCSEYYYAPIQEAKLY